MLGIKLFSTIYAVNGAGLQSEQVSSNGITVDASPPVVLSSRPNGEELILNPVFETELEASIIPQWNIDGSVTLSNSTVILSDKGSVCQSVPTNINRFHIVEINLSLPDEVALQESLAVLCLPNHEDIIHVTSQSIIHTMIFMARELSSTICIKSSGRDSLFAVDYVSCKEVQQTERDQDANGLIVTVQTSGMMSNVRVSWSAVDEESGIRSYIWAIGYVPGNVLRQK